jgi:hypothetical protein
MEESVAERFGREAEDENFDWQRHWSQIEFPNWARRREQVQVMALHLRNLHVQDIEESKFWMVLWQKTGFGGNKWRTQYITPDGSKTSNEVRLHAKKKNSAQYSPRRKGARKVYHRGFCPDSIE